MTLEDSGEQVPMLSAVLVAPPNVGAEDFVEVFNAGVNARRIAFQYDIVPQAFCTPSMPTCAGPLRGLFKVGTTPEHTPSASPVASSRRPKPNAPALSLMRRPWFPISLCPPSTNSSCAELHGGAHR
jgi:hypothetical protein